MARAARLLIIAGSDSGGGAGIQADLKTASARGVYAATAITAITAQNTRGVLAARMMPPALVAEQIAAVLDDIGADAIKIGMLGNAGIVEAVAGALAGFSGPIVLDPVMAAKSGDALLDDAGIEAMRRHLVPRTTLLTPNLPEAALLTGSDPAGSAADAKGQGTALLAMGPGAVLIKGGHAEGALCTDLMMTAHETTHLSALRIATRNTHGTGCSLASAIAAELARGESLPEAARIAHHWLHGAILAADRLGIGGGHGPIHHFHEVWA